MAERTNLRRWAAVTLGILATLTVHGGAPAHAGTPTTAPLLEVSQAPPANARGDRALEVQRRYQESRAAHSRAENRLAELQRHLTERRAQAEGAMTLADEAAAAIGTSSIGILDVVGSWARGDDALDDAHDAMREAEHQQNLADITEQGVVRARHELGNAARAHRAARERAELLARSTSGRAAARLALEWATLPSEYRASTPARDVQNRRALTAWRSNLRAMGEAGITPPPAAAFERRRLPADLRPARDDAGRTIPGAAVARGKTGDRFTVLPDVTVRAVSAAFGSLGTVAASSDTSCADFVHRIWEIAQADVPTDSVGQWSTLTAVPERQVTVGDVVFFRRASAHRVGLVVGRGLVVAFDPTADEIAVQRVAPSGMLSVRRVTLSAERGARRAAVPAVVRRDCRPPAETQAALPTSTISGWSMPIIEGSYSMSAGFGVVGALWSSGSHTGQDFAAPLGTPVVAAAEGRVIVERVSWSGQLVRIDHGGGVETWYAHMSRVDVVSGESVARGAVVGAVGSEGNSTGPHLHFEVRRNGTPTDPMPFLGADPGR